MRDIPSASATEATPKTKTVKPKVERGQALRWNLQMASREFGVNRETMERRRRKDDVQPGEDGCFTTAQIVKLCFEDNQAAANLKLTVAREEQIKLEMECTRKERLARMDVDEVNLEVHSNVAGILKAQLGKMFDEQALADCLAELRSVPERLK